jgi:hypothetical protein
VGGTVIAKLTDNRIALRRIYMSKDLKGLLTCIGIVVTLFATALVTIYFSLDLRIAFNPAAFVGLIYMFIGFVAMALVGGIVILGSLTNGTEA